MDSMFTYASPRWPEYMREKCHPRIAFTITFEKFATLLA